MFTTKHPGEALRIVSTMSKDSKITVSAFKEIGDFFVSKKDVDGLTKIIRMMPDSEGKVALGAELMKLQLKEGADSLRKILPSQVPSDSEIESTFDEQMERAQKRVNELAQLSLPELEELLKKNTEQLNGYRQHFKNALRSGRQEFIDCALEAKAESLKKQIMLENTIAYKKEVLKKEGQPTHSQSKEEETKQEVASEQKEAPKEKESSCIIS